MHYGVKNHGYKIIYSSSLSSQILRFLPASPKKASYLCVCVCFFIFGEPHKANSPYLLQYFPKSTPYLYQENVS